MLNKQKIKELAVKIRDLLFEYNMWTDVRIYFNNKAFCTMKDDKFYYNDRNNLVVIDNINPKDYFKYTAEPHILSMSFECEFYEVLNYGASPVILEKFEALLKEYGLYYEMGNQWNLTCYSL